MQGLSSARAASASSVPGSSSFTETYTVTFGDQAENHAGMQKIGKAQTSGLTFQDLDKARAWFDERGCKTELVALHEAAGLRCTPAYLLIARNGLATLLGEKGTVEEVLGEQKALPKDTKVKMRGAVKNKLARHNLCFGETAQEANFEEGRGTIVAFSSVPLLAHIRSSLPVVFGEKTKSLVAEGNYYYNPQKCGIGWHGDSERRVVVAFRLGASLPLHFHWFYRFQPIGKRVEFVLDHGDVYAMSEIAVGTEWKKSSVYTLRHAAGADKYLKL